MTRLVLVYQSECCFVIPAIIFNMFKTDQEYKDLAFLPGFLSYVRQAGSCSCGEKKEKNSTYVAFFKSQMVLSFWFHQSATSSVQFELFTSDW